MAHLVAAFALAFGAVIVQIIIVVTVVIRRFIVVVSGCCVVAWAVTLATAIIFIIFIHVFICVTVALAIGIGTIHALSLAVAGFTLVLAHVVVATSRCCCCCPSRCWQFPSILILFLIVFEMNLKSLDFDFFQYYPLKTDSMRSCYVVTIKKNHKTQETNVKPWCLVPCIIPMKIVSILIKTKNY